MERRVGGEITIERLEKQHLRENWNLSCWEKEACKGLQLPKPKTWVSPLSSNTIFWNGSKIKQVKIICVEPIVQLYSLLF